MSRYISVNDTSISWFRRRGSCRLCVLPKSDSYQENKASRGHVRYEDVHLILQTSVNNANDLQPTQASHPLSLWGVYSRQCIVASGAMVFLWHEVGRYHLEKCIITSAYRQNWAHSWSSKAFYTMQRRISVQEMGMSINIQHLAGGRNCNLSLHD